MAQTSTKAGTCYRRSIWYLQAGIIHTVKISPELLEAEPIWNHLSKTEQYQTGLRNVDLLMVYDELPG